MDITQWYKETFYQFFIHFWANLKFSLTDNPHSHRLYFPYTVFTHQLHYLHSANCEWMSKSDNDLCIYPRTAEQVSHYSTKDCTWRANWYSWQLKPLSDLETTQSRMFCLACICSWEGYMRKLLRHGLSSTPVMNRPINTLSLTPLTWISPITNEETSHEGLEAAFWPV